MASSSCSSSSINHQEKYDVFLSFRGEDTRANFTSHLYSALCRKQVQTFIDNQLERGDEISAALLKSIEESKISVVIFSTNYASSKWCLDELSKIMKCKQVNGQVVIPIFYQVDPSHVRKQTGSFGNAFVKHKKQSQQKVLEWRTALTNASNLSGWDSSVTSPDSRLIDEIVKDILKKLKNMSSSSDYEGLVGIGSRVEQIKLLLCIEELDFRVIGIWGMGGIGKTTLAGVVFNEISSQFEEHCYFANVKESEKCGGLVHLRERILCRILEEEYKDMGAPDLPKSIKDRLRRKKVFIVLDDVTNSKQFEFLTGGLDRFGPGSRIIITTRNKQFLCNIVHDKNIYEVALLEYDKALELFCMYAFKQDYPVEDFMGLATGFVNHVKCNPLALKVLGASLYQKSKQFWESALNKLERISNPEIYDVLITSYDGLDGEEKKIFLDIACFFKGNDKDFATKILDSCYYSLHTGLIVLIDKALVTITQDNKLDMHDLLQDMGWEIVRRESQEPGKRSRLWNHEDLDRVLGKNTGTEAVEGMFLDMSKITNINLSPKAFAKMYNLRFLKFYFPPHQCLKDNSKVHVPRGIGYLSDELRYLHWHSYPLKTLPSTFDAKNLIQLNLPYSKVEQLWKGRRDMPKLKSIDLSHSPNLIGIPDFSNSTPQLEEIKLDYCTSLLDISSSIQNLHNLKSLSMEGCQSLRSFQSNIHFGSPGTLNLSRCINLTNFSQISGNITRLNLRENTFEEVPSSIGSLTGLVHIYLDNCTKLRILPTSICKLKSLSLFTLGGCSALESFPEILEKMESLEELCLDETAIKGLSSSIENLNGLSRLTLDGCRNIESLPNNIGNLGSLEYVAFSDCPKLDKLPERSGNIQTLQGFRASIVLPPLSGFCAIKSVTLRYCNITEIPKDIGCLSSLTHLVLGGNNFESLPTSIKQLSQLDILDLEDCNMLLSIPCLPLGLSYLYANNCERLQSLPELPPCLEQLYAPEQVKMDEDANIISSKFMFINCPKLNQEVYNNNFAVDSQLRIQYMAAAYEKLYESTHHQISICLPGSEIPDWFICRSFGSLLTIQVPHHWFNNNFIGFAVCAVIEFEGCPLNFLYFNLDCKCHFETNYGQRVDSSFSLAVHTYELASSTVIDTDHVILGYICDPDLNVEVLKGDYIAGSFQFSDTSSDPFLPRNGLKVKCCGVCPQYAQSSYISTEKLGATRETVGEEYTKIHDEVKASDSGSGSTIQDFEETMAEEDTSIYEDDKASTRGRSYEEEAETRPSSFCGLCVFGMLSFLCNNFFQKRPRLDRGQTSVLT